MTSNQPLCVAQFMVVLDIAIVNVALPPIPVAVRAAPRCTQASVTGAAAGEVAA
jgi:hypothetical protein